MEFNRRGLLKYIRDDFKLPESSVHGPAHWGRVKNIGMKLCDCNSDADRLVVEIFGWCHDMARTTDSEDFEHGKLAVDIILSELQGVYFNLNDHQLSALLYAIRWHSDGYVVASKTVQVCWDSDRLDLGRVGIIPDPKRLCTDTAKNPQFINWAYNNSIKIG